MRKTNSALWLLAIALGLGIGAIDYTASEVQATLLFLLPVALCFGLAAPGPAWRWALVLGLAIPVVHVLGHAVNVRPPYPETIVSSMLALIPAFLAVYTGAALRWLASKGQGRG